MRTTAATARPAYSFGRRGDEGRAPVSRIRGRDLRAVWAVTAWSARGGGRVVAAEQDAQVDLERSNRSVAGPRHGREDLRDVVEIVRSPRREQLAERHLAERGVEALPVEICGG